MKVTNQNAKLAMAKIKAGTTKAKLAAKTAKRQINRDRYIAKTNLAGKNAAARTVSEVGKAVATNLSPMTGAYAADQISKNVMNNQYAQAKLNSEQELEKWKAQLNMQGGENGQAGEKQNNATTSIIGG